MRAALPGRAGELYGLPDHHVLADVPVLRRFAGACERCNLALYDGDEQYVLVTKSGPHKVCKKCWLVKRARRIGSPLVPYDNDARSSAAKDRAIAAALRAPRS